MASTRAVLFAKMFLPAVIGLGACAVLVAAKQSMGTALAGGVFAAALGSACWVTLEPRIKARRSPRGGGGRHFCREEPEASLELLFDTAPYAISISGMDDRVVVINHTMERELGYTNEEMVGKTPQELGLVGPLPEEVWREFHATGSAGPFERLVTRKDGRRVHALVSLRLLRAKAETFIVRFGVNIEASKEVELRLRESERRLSDAISASASSVWEWDLRTGKAAFSLGWFEMLGYKDQEFEVDLAKLRELTHPDDFQPMRDAIRRGGADPAQGGFEFEFRLRHKDGRWVWMHSRGNVIERAGDGTPAVVAGTNIDITERKAAEETLRASNALLEAIFRAAPAATCFVRNRKFVAASDYTLQIFGYTHQEMVGQSTRMMYFSDEEFERAGELFARPTSAPPMWEFRLRRKDGSPVYVLMSVVPLDPKNLSVGMVASAVDITDRKLAEERVKQALAEAEAANRAKDLFLAAASHELRTPLTPVLLIASSLGTDQSVPADLREDLATLRENVLIQKRLIDDLLDFTAIHAGRLRIRAGTVHLHEILLAAVRTVEAEADRKEIGIETSFLHGPDALSGDSDRLRQVFWNLLQNAVKFTPAGGKITVRSESDADGFTVEVTDTGMGIEASELPKIFNPFEQGARSQILHHGGLGLGLPISKAVVEAHGGTITASSPGPSKGCNMIVRLPRVSMPTLAVLSK